MSGAAEISNLDTGIDDALARRNAKVLAVAQALAGGNNTVIVSTGAIIGAVLAPDKGLATLPITFMVLGMGWGRCRSARWRTISAAALRCRPARCSACCRVWCPVPR